MSDIREFLDKLVDDAVGFAKDELVGFINSALLSLFLLF